MTDNWLIVDVHNHYYPERTADLAGRMDGMDLVARMQSRPGFYTKAFDLENRLKMMDEVGVDMVVLSQTPWSPRGENTFAKRPRNALHKRAHTISSTALPT